MREKNLFHTSDYNPKKEITYTDKIYVTSTSARLEINI